MTLKRFGILILACLFLCICSHAQTVAGSIVGVAVDPSGAVIPGAIATLTDQNTSATRTAVTDADGTFRFPNVLPSTYTVAIDARGFKQSITAGIELGSSENRDLGKVGLSVGSTAEQVTVTAAVTPIQTSSSEKSLEIDGSELDALPLRGRDLFGSVRLVPGVIDTNNNRDVTTNAGSFGSITINGNASNKNFTVDGVSDIDNGGGAGTHYEPNMDSVQEVKILSSNYQAEFGRNSGGTIAVVTKSGTQQFHGTGWWNHRHEEFNANDWANKLNYNPGQPNDGIIPRQHYRYNVDGWSLGGPVYIPGHFNSEKKRVFFFASEEFTGQLATNPLQTKTVPTAIEEGVGTTAAECTSSNFGALGAGCADFSQTVSSTGAHLNLIDPTTSNKFPLNGSGVCCLIPANRISSQGQQMLEFFPLPNFVPPAGSSLFNQANFEAQSPNQHSRRNDVVRIDVNATSKLTAYFRWINDYDDQETLFQGVQFVGNEPRGNGQSGNPTFSIDHPNPGHGYAGSAIWTLSPSLVNEVVVSKSWNSWSWYFNPITLAEYSRATKYNPGLNPPTLFPLPTSPSGVNGYDALLPSLSFGTDLPNMISLTNCTCDYFNQNPVWTVEDNVSKVVGQHQFKTGFYWEHSVKEQPSGLGYNGAFNFATDNTNPLNTGDGFANALLGYYDSYTQQTARSVFNVVDQNLEFYVQDNWKITRRLTLDLGVRFYHQTPFEDTNDTYSEFVPSTYNAANVPRFFVPACTVAISSGSTCPNADRRSVDPKNPAQYYPFSDVGAFVPGSGSYSNGMVQLGKNGAPLPTYTRSWLAPGPRIGFAYDVFGNGKTALRGGFGVFFNRAAGNQVNSLSGQPPASFTQADNQDTLANLTAIEASGQGGVVAPVNVTSISGKLPWDVVRNASLGIQQDLGHSTMVDVSWVANFGRDSDIMENINPVPLGADFTHISQVTGLGLTQNNSSLERTVYPGLTDINIHTFVGYSNYNALDVTLQRRLTNGLLLGVSYSWSKALGVTSYDQLVPNNDAWGYGPITTDRRQNLLINYSYALPDPAKRLNIRAISAVTSHWTFTGLTTFQSGAPFTPTFVAQSAQDITGSGDQTPRLDLVSNPKANVPAGYIFNPAAFAAPTQGSATACALTCLGNEGIDAVYGRGLNDFDWTMEKFIPVGKTERRGFLIQVQAYNVFNHPQLTDVTSAARFSATFVPNTNNLVVASQTLTNGTAFGKPTGDTASSGPRIMSFNLRFQF